MSRIRLSGENAVKSLGEADKERADLIRAKAKEEADAEYKALSDEARREADKRLALAASARETLVSRERLAEKTAAVDAAIALAKEKLGSMADADYFAALEGLILKNFSRGDGELVLNERDAARLPEGFIASVNSKLAPEASLKLASDRAGIDGGCLIRLGLIEENLSFEAILRDRIEAVRDGAASVLFG
ncbi:MAG: hypothetical protein IJV00_09835 [Clostridia bacterium]|nr:hypothetical protein [Clostridia bacterium]